MSSRERILENVKKNLPREAALPVMEFATSTTATDPVSKFKIALTEIGGVVVDVSDWNEIKSFVENKFQGTDRIISLVPELGHETNNFNTDPHLFNNVTLAILPGHFAVAENGAVWITETSMGDRALPFITEHLALVVSKKNIVHTLHDAYERIATLDYDLGTFIAGPSKTADIEQSLVLGAHGAKSLTVFLLDFE